jgi:hypothetical protein
MTPRAAVLIEPADGWALTLASSLNAGSHAFVITSEVMSIEARRAGFELRDTVLILSEGPSSRYAFLFRKPAQETTTLSQIVETGAGSLNIAACRIGWGQDTPSQDEWNTKGSTGSGSQNIGQNTEGMRKAYADGTVPVPTGRWPPNVLFVHGHRCRRTGVRRVRSDGHHPGHRGSAGVWSGEGGGLNGNEGPDIYMGEDGLEAVHSYDCQPDCPVRILDEQTGERPSTLTGRADPTQTHENPGDNHGASLFGGGNSSVYADSGGASRFYPQFRNDQEMIAWMQRLLEAPARSHSKPPPGVSEAP